MAQGKRMKRWTGLDTAWAMVSLKCGEHQIKMMCTPVSAINSSFKEQALLGLFLK